jgi:hypothetical protein
MSAESWLVGSASLEAAHEKYGSQFEVAYREFRNHAGAVESDLFERQGLWLDHENRGENVMSWFQRRQA